MTKEKKILIYFISFILGLFTIMLVGIINVKADTYNSSQYTAKLYDNYGPNLSGVTTSLSNNSWRGTIPTMVANSAGAAWGISSPIVLLANHTYTLTVQIEGSFGGNIVLSTYNRIGIGTSLSNAVTSYQNNSSVTENYSRVLNDGVSIQFAFTPTTNGSYIVFPFSTSSGGNDYQFVLTNIVIDDLGNSGVSQSQITSSLDSQTNEINSSIENSTNTITDAITETEDNINNKIDDTFQSCPDPVELSYSTGKKFNTSGELIDAEGFYYTENYYSFDSQHRITFKNAGSSTVGYVILYNSDKTVTGYYGIRDRTLYLPSAVYYRLSTNKPDMQVYLGNGECTNKIDETNDKLDETNDKLDGIQGELTDSSAPNTSGLENSAGWLPAGPLDSVLNLPLSLFNALTTNLNKNCNPINIPLPYVNKNITLPCINTLYNQIGITSFLSWVGVIVSGLMLYTYLLKLYKWIEDRISLNETHNVDSWGGL